MRNAKFYLTFAVLFLFLTAAHAVEVAKCPTAFSVNVLNISPYRTSISSSIPGWIDARDRLQTFAPELTIELELYASTAQTCTYLSPSGASAKLLTISQFDQEDGVTYTSDRLLVKFEVGGSFFTMFPEIETYSPSSIRLYSQDAPQKTRIQTRLVNPRTTKLLNFDVGLANIKTN